MLANVVNGAVNVLMTIVAIRLLDRTGRRPLLLGGTTGMAAGMIVVAFTFLIGGSDLHGSGAYIAIAGLLIYTGSFAIGLGPVFWLLEAPRRPAARRLAAYRLAARRLAAYRLAARRLAAYRLAPCRLVRAGQQPRQIGVAVASRGTRSNIGRGAMSR